MDSSSMLSSNCSKASLLFQDGNPASELMWMDRESQNCVIKNDDVEVKIIQTKYRNNKVIVIYEMKLKINQEFRFIICIDVGRQMCKYTFFEQPPKDYKQLYKERKGCTYEDVRIADEELNNKINNNEDVKLSLQVRKAFQQLKNHLQEIVGNSKSIFYNLQDIVQYTEGKPSHSFKQLFLQFFGDHPNFSTSKDKSREDHQFLYIMQTSLTNQDHKSIIKVNIYKTLDYSIILVQEICLIIEQNLMKVYEFQISTIIKTHTQLIDTKNHQYMKCYNINHFKYFQILQKYQTILSQQKQIGKTSQPIEQYVKDLQRNYQKRINFYPLVYFEIPYQGACIDKEIHSWVEDNKPENKIYISNSGSNVHVEFFILDQNLFDAIKNKLYEAVYIKQLPDQKKKQEQNISSKEKKSKKEQNKVPERTQQSKNTEIQNQTPLCQSSIPFVDDQLTDTSVQFYKEINQDLSPKKKSINKSSSSNDTIHSQLQPTPSSSISQSQQIAFQDSNYKVNQIDEEDDEYHGNRDTTTTTKEYQTRSKTKLQSQNQEFIRNQTGNEYILAQNQTNEQRPNAYPYYQNSNYNMNQNQPYLNQQSNNNLHFNTIQSYPSTKKQGDNQFYSLQGQSQNLIQSSIPTIEGTSIIHRTQNGDNILISVSQYNQNNQLKINIQEHNQNLKNMTPQGSEVIGLNGETNKINSSNNINTNQQERYCEYYSQREEQKDEKERVLNAGNKQQQSSIPQILIDHNKQRQILQNIEQSMKAQQNINIRLKQNNVQIWAVNASNNQDQFIQQPKDNKQLNEEQTQPYCYEQQINAFQTNLEKYKNKSQEEVNNLSTILFHSNNCNLETYKQKDPPTAPLPPTDLSMYNQTTQNNEESNYFIQSNNLFPFDELYQNI